MDTLYATAGLNFEFDVNVFSDEEAVIPFPLADYHVIIWTRRADNRAVNQWSSEDEPAKVIVEPGPAFEDGFVQVRLDTTDSALLRSGELRILAQRKDNAASVSPIADNVELVVDN